MFSKMDKANWATERQGNVGGRGREETRRQGDKETRRQGDKETRRQGDKETIPHQPLENRISPLGLDSSFSLSPPLLVSLSGL